MFETLASQIDEIDNPSISEQFIQEFRFEVNEITKDIAANGTLIAYLERPAGENNPKDGVNSPNTV